jgi:A/G-specific adenine glycosylase
MDFTSAIIAWYGKNKRELPWRDTSDPYKIWVSEVILQQTRVEQGYGYYGRFLEKFPDIGSLAEAPEDEVLKVWQGLGYYSRARNMQQAAREIRENMGDRFPDNYNGLLRLKGIGDYSASAISSIAFNEPRPVIDGNVRRVMARYLGIDIPMDSAPANRLVKETLEVWIDRNQPGTFNQAVMELGAMVCLPRNPACSRCPVAESCIALRKGLTGALPVRGKPLAKKAEHYYYFVFLAEEGGQRVTWLKKRTGKGIWHGLYDFPRAEPDGEIAGDAIGDLPEFRKMTGQYNLAGPPVIAEKVKHRLSHREMMLTFVIVPVSHHEHTGHLRVPLDDIHNYPVPRPIEIFLKKLIFDRVYF